MIIQQIRREKYKEIKMEQTLISDLIEILGVNLDPKHLNKNTNLTNSNLFFLDSLDLLELLLAIEEIYVVRLSKC